MKSHKFKVHMIVLTAMLVCAIATYASAQSTERARQYISPLIAREVNMNARCIDKYVDHCMRQGSTAEACWAAIYKAEVVVDISCRTGGE